MTDPDDFWNNYRVFAMSLDFLARGPEEQCALMGNYNVAWELKTDVQAGAYLVASSPEMFSVAQAESIRALSLGLETIPTDVLNAAVGAELNAAAMRHEVWIPLRHRAASLLSALALLNARCEAFLSTEVPE